jgi:hypothetical protein
LARDERLKSFNFQIGNWHKVIMTTASGDYNRGRMTSVFYFNNDDPLNSRALEADELLEKMKLPVV